MAFLKSTFFKLVCTKRKSKKLVGVNTALGGAKAKDALDGGVNLGSLDFGAPIPITSNGFWYYDETSKVVVWGGFNLVPVKATSSELELKFSYGDKSQISYNYTWKFSR